MKLFNTPNRRIEEITPLKPPSISVYTCGPTVYDYPHIGNWFTFIRYDLLVRVLRAEGLKPRWVMNITDVGHLVSDADEGEDKLEKGARREGKTAREIADYYSNYFIESLKRLGINEPDELPKATDYINEQIALIKILETKGYTYVIDDGVYFDTSRFKTYADFAGLNLAGQAAGTRVEVNPQKRNPTDFALWKFSPKSARRDMEWNSPWGKGFPGWHLECSAMSMKLLGETLDIHGGGIDHIPVHHTNEIAQSEAATGKKFARHWFHSNFITVDGQKMAKSAGNFYTLEDIEARGYSLTAFRLLVIESHYRTQASFSWNSLAAAQNTLKNLYAWADLGLQSFESSRLAADYAECMPKLKSELSNDLSTPSALKQLHGMVNRVMEFGIDSRAITSVATEIDNLLGLDLHNRQDITDAQKKILDERALIRSQDKWEEADILRQELKKQGIGVRDTLQGQAWFRL